MKYKVGDKVRIKSKEWYDNNKDSRGDVTINSDIHFWKGMNVILGKEFTIKAVDDIWYRLNESMYAVTEEMIETLVNEEIIKDITEVIKKHNLGVSVSEKDGKIIVEPLEVEEDLPIDTPCMVSDSAEDWTLRYYAKKGECYINGKKSSNSEDYTGWEYVVPFDKFNPNDIEGSLKHNIVK